MTPQDIIVLALRSAGVTGVGQSANTDDLSDALAMLNMMVAQWAQKRWLTFREIDIAVQCTGAGSYSVGPGGSFNTPRPDQLEAAFARTRYGGNAIDYPLEIIEAREDWNAIPIKSQPGFPSLVFYDPQFPLGVVNVYPVPSASYDLHLSLKQQITQFATLTENIGLPPQYFEALFYNLALRLAPAYQISVSPIVQQLAAASLNAIRNSNTQIARLSMPLGLPGMWQFGFSGAVGPFVGGGLIIDGIGLVDDGAEGDGVLDSIAVANFGALGRSSLPFALA